MWKFFLQAPVVIWCCYMGLFGLTGGDSFVGTSTVYGQSLPHKETSYVLGNSDSSDRSWQGHVFCADAGQESSTTSSSTKGDDHHNAMLTADDSQHLSCLSTADSSAVSRVMAPRQEAWQSLSLSIGSAPVLVGSVFISRSAGLLERIPFLGKALVTSAAVAVAGGYVASVWGGSQRSAFEGLALLSSSSELPRPRPRKRRTGKREISQINRETPSPSGGPFKVPPPMLAQENGLSTHHNEDIEAILRQERRESRRGFYHHKNVQAQFGVSDVGVSAEDKEDPVFSFPLFAHSQAQTLGESVHALSQNLQKLAVDLYEYNESIADYLKNVEIWRAIRPRTSMYANTDNLRSQLYGQLFTQQEWASVVQQGISYEMLGLKLLTLANKFHTVGRTLDNDLEDFKGITETLEQTLRSVAQGLLRLRGDFARRYSFPYILDYQLPLDILVPERLIGLGDLELPVEGDVVGYQAKNTLLFQLGAITNVLGEYLAYYNHRDNHYKEEPFQDFNIFHHMFPHAGDKLVLAAHLVRGEIFELKERLLGEDEDSAVLSAYLRASRHKRVLFHHAADRVDIESRDEAGYQEELRHYFEHYAAMVHPLYRTVLLQSLTLSDNNLRHVVTAAENISSQGTQIHVRRQKPLPLHEVDDFVREMIERAREDEDDEVNPEWHGLAHDLEDIGDFYKRQNYIDMKREFMYDILQRSDISFQYSDGSHVSEEDRAVYRAAWELFVVYVNLRYLNAHLDKQLGNKSSWQGDTRYVRMLEPEYPKVKGFQRLRQFDGNEFFFQDRVAFELWGHFGSPISLEEMRRQERLQEELYGLVVGGASSAVDAADFRQLFSTLSVMHIYLLRAQEVASDIRQSIGEEKG